MQGHMKQVSMGLLNSYRKQDHVESTEEAGPVWAYIKQPYMRLQEAGLCGASGSRPMWGYRKQAYVGENSTHKHKRSNYSLLVGP
jgi:hypothetical protein